jgi:predicted amidohydrolase
MKVYVCQFAPEPGNCAKNYSGHLLPNINLAAQHGCDVVVFPELCLTGTAPSSWLSRGKDKREAFHEHAEMMRKLHAHLRGLSRDLTVVLGGVYLSDEPFGHKTPYNAIWVLNKSITGWVRPKRISASDWRECEFFIPYDGPEETIKLQVGREHRADVLRCGFTFIDEVVWKYAPPEADVIFVVGAASYSGSNLVRSIKAIEHLSVHAKAHVIFCNAVGYCSESGRSAFGASMVCPHTAKSPVSRVAKTFAEDVLVSEVSDKSCPHEIFDVANPVAYAADLGLRMPEFQLPWMEKPVTVSVNDFPIYARYMTVFGCIREALRVNRKQLLSVQCDSLGGSLLTLIAAHAIGAEKVLAMVFERASSSPVCPAIPVEVVTIAPGGVEKEMVRSSGVVEAFVGDEPCKVSAEMSDFVGSALMQCGAIGRGALAVGCYNRTQIVLSGYPSGRFPAEPFAGYSSTEVSEMAEWINRIADKKLVPESLLQSEPPPDWFGHDWETINRAIALIIDEGYTLDEIVSDKKCDIAPALARKILGYLGVDR